MSKFLDYSYSFDNVECVVVMVGSGQETRLRILGAKQIVEEGQSDVLLIPAYNQIAFAEDFKLGDMAYMKMAPVFFKPVKFLGRSCRIFENTHLEMLKAKKFMDKLGYRSAVIVSSPYHMRRLQLIAWKVFGDGYRIGFQATQFEKYDTWCCFKSEVMLKNVASEYLKIGWFLVYNWFV